MKIICKIFGHKIGIVNTERKFSKCQRCDIGLKLSYDMTYGNTVIVGDYGSQTTFAWCFCGNELCSSNSFIEDSDAVYYRCSKCLTKSKWNFDAPAPILLWQEDIYESKQ